MLSNLKGKAQVNKAGESEVATHFRLLDFHVPYRNVRYY